VGRIFTPVRILIAGLLLLAVVGVLWLVPSDDYILLPSKAQPLAGLVTVEGERDDHDGGGIYYVAVELRKASLLERLFHGLHEGASLVPARDILGPSGNVKQYRKEEIKAMALSQELGAVVGLRALHKPVAVVSPGTVIGAVDEDGPSAGKLEANDLVVSADGKPTPFLRDLRRAIRSSPPGSTVRLRVRRGDAVKNVDVKSVADPEQANQPIIGIQADCASQRLTQIKLPVPVHIDLGRVGGPSAGLAFALDVVEELGHNVDRGYRVAATGELCEDGSVLPIGGVKQKTIGARRAGVDVFLVPEAGDNAKEARRYADGMRIIPVQSFRQALRALATLPPKQS